MNDEMIANVDVAFSRLRMFGSNLKIQFVQSCKVKKGHRLKACGLTLCDLPTVMSQPSLNRQAQEEPDRRDRTPDDEQRLQDVGRDVRDVRDFLPRGHRDVVRPALGEPGDEKRQDRPEPHNRCSNGYPDIPPMVTVAMVPRRVQLVTLLGVVGHLRRSRVAVHRCRRGHRARRGRR